MKAVLVALSPSIGMQFYTAGLANTLLNEGTCEVWVFGSAAQRKDAFDGGVRLAPSYSFASTGLSLSALDLLKFRRLLTEIRELRTSLVHLTGPHLWNLPLALSLRGRFPLVLTVHDAAAHEGARGAQIKNTYQRAAARVVDHVIVHSRAVAEALQHWAVPPSSVSIMPLVHHNFDYSLYQEIRADVTRVHSYEDTAVFFGRLEEYKGVRQFLDSARLLSTVDQPTIEMIVAGTGSLSSILDEYRCLQNLVVCDRIIGDDETIGLFGRAGLIVLPYSEGSQSALIPLAYLFKKPVLVTRVGALPEYVRGQITGRIIDSNEPTTLAQAIRDLISDKEALIKMGNAGSEYLQELEEEFHSRLLETYHTVTEMGSE